MHRTEFRGLFTDLVLYPQVNGVFSICLKFWVLKGSTKLSQEAFLGSTEVNAGWDIGKQTLNYWSYATRVFS